MKDERGEDEKEERWKRRKSEAIRSDERKDNKRERNDAKY